MKKKSSAEPKIGHPARFSPPILDDLVFLTKATGPSHILLDPFAGVGGLFGLRKRGYEGWFEFIEIEQEWQAMIPQDEKTTVLLGDMRSILPLMQPSIYRDVVTSPTYANRLADHHNAKDKSLRRSYKFDLGRDLTPGNSGAMQWGAEYQTFHAQAWRLVFDLLTPGRRLILNISDHIRGGEVIPVTLWHLQTCQMIGFHHRDTIDVPTVRMRYGANSGLRVRTEHILVLERP